MTSAVLVAVRVDADPARAFAAFTQEIGAWWRPSGLFQITPHGDGELRFEGGEGGRLVTRLPNGAEFEIGHILVWAPPERLAFSWRQASFTPDQETHVDVRFEPVGQQTRVTVRAPRVGRDPARARGAARLSGSCDPAACRRVVA
jgi:uncharacterized protein YndB with AHSA1/START domain